MSIKMTRYKPTEFVDEDTSSIGSIQLNDATSPSVHFGYTSNRGTSFWHRRSELEKFLLATIALLLITCVTLLVITISLNTSKQSKTTSNYQKIEEVCLEKHCIHAASQILRSLDDTIDPCDDFYAFSCNQWIKNNPIPNGKSLYGTFAKIEEQNQIVVKMILERKSNELKSKAEKKAQLYYKSCLDEEEIIEKLGSKPMLDLLQQLGDWNVTNKNFSTSKWTLQHTLQIVHNKFNMGGLFGWAVGEDDKNSSAHILQIDQGGLTLPTRENYLNKTEQHDKILAALLDYMVKICMLLGAENEQDTRYQMKAIIEFETLLAKITTPNDDRQDEEKMYLVMKLSELQIKAPFINWQIHFADAFRLVGKKKINDEEKVVVYAIDYLTNLTSLIKNYTDTNDGKIILNNYLVWQTLSRLTACLSKPFRDAYKGLRKALIGSDGGEEPWRYCVTDTNNALGFAIGAMFVREVFHGDSKPQAEEMIAEIKKAFTSNLKNLNWMDDQTRLLAEEKANAITDMIGFPDYILNSSQLDEKYKDLDIDPGKYFENNIRLNVYNLKKNLERLYEPVNKSRWSMSPATVNAYYTPTKNQVVFPAGILQIPFYDIKNANYLNFGAMGVVMGHELVHALDNQGREYDKYGNLNRWWNNQTIEKFNTRTKCFVKQYENYKMNGKSLNGKQTLGENIADNGGLKSAYHAYLSSKSFSKPSDFLPLPGLNLTHHQLFFVSFAQVWCSAITDETINLQIEKDPHSPPKYRVIGPLSNLPDFSKSFKCVLGSKMNPIDKCEVW